MKKLLFRLVFLTILLFVADTVTSQDNLYKRDKRFKPNSIHLNPGTGFPLALYISGFVNYDRILKENLFQSKIHVFGRASFGGIVNWTDESIISLLQAGFFTGNKNSHFEFALGGMYMNTLPNRSRILPSGQLGYRYQKPNGAFVFRSGAGFPELIYLGMGFSF